MKIEYCDKLENKVFAFGTSALGVFSVFNGLISSNTYIIGFGGALISAGAVTLKNSFDNARIIEADIEELTNINEVKTNYLCKNSGEKKEFIGKIERFSDYKVENIRGEINNIRTTGFIFKDTLADLVDEKGYSIPCIFPLKIKLKEGQKLNLSAYLRKIKMSDKTSKNGLVAYSLN